MLTLILTLTLEFILLNATSLTMLLLNETLIKTLLLMPLSRLLLKGPLS
jgi:hypothetical protein